MDELKTLVERSRHGDLEAFGRIVECFQAMAIGYAEAYLHDFHIAEDVAQEAFIAAYLRLDALRAPEAFPGWFRRILHTQCNRMLRRRRLKTVPIEEGLHVTQPEAGRREMPENVIEALRSLPEAHRMVVTLFYINGYSQNEIAGFLEVPLTTVQKRLHDSRRKLKKGMMNMVGETLKGQGADERFSQSVINGLLMRPKLLEMPGHPVFEVAQALFGALTGYEHANGDEAIDKDTARPLLTYPDRVYHVSEERILRPETTVSAFAAARRRQTPIRLVMCGRVFRPDEENKLRLKVFHQLDVLHIADDACEALMYATLRQAVKAVLGEVELHFTPCDYPITDNGSNAHVIHKGRDVGIAGCGMVARRGIEYCGLDANTTRGFAFGMGLERLAMIKYDISDIRSLWRPPLAL